MPLSKTVARQKNYRERLKSNPEKYKEVKKKDNERHLIRNMMEAVLEEKRRRDRERKREARKRKREMENLPPECSSYQDTWSLEEATKRVQKCLPKSPTKQAAVLAQIYNEMSPRRKKMFHEQIELIDETEDCGQNR
ncbi:uncharacterized protein LOC106168611 [Lingula anatina]|uniref:Uncharacterized protein LOC106168611 n=1 Tax=Lingula anatina TaxID=7574 RepID=A0A1S3J064_LINAN|nr:uncharacterized protein LOC106168611 [Lingula anatina]|eukprot:XP_013403194.1 uncharacterized protein LOC106168611 [Lingula anatina]